MNHIGLFEGIGGFSLAAKWMGWESIAWCEINPFCQTVLRYYHPHAKEHHDITKTDFSIYRGLCDIITGGFPCQPYSAAGKRLGKEDDRHLWPEMLRAIREVQPSYVVGENVRGLTNWNGGMVFDEVQADLELAGYEVLPFLLPACAVNAPHRRDRIWFIAYSNTNGSMRATRENERTGGKERVQERHKMEQPHKPNSLRGFSTHAEGNREYRAQELENGNRQSGERRRCDFDNIGQVSGQNGCANVANSNKRHGEAQRERGILEQPDRKRAANGRSHVGGASNWNTWPTQSPLCSRNDGFSTELSGITFSKHRNESIKAYGNAIVPQVAFEIFRAIELLENKTKLNLCI